MDSHFALPTVPHDRARLLEFELLPFEAASNAGLDALMTAHVALPNVAEEVDMPATVSRNVLTNLLRQELGYEGVVVTDGLEMAGIVSRYSSGEAAVRAVLAGADMVMAHWSSESKEEVHRSLAEAVRSGRVPLSRLDESVRRILRTKSRRGLFRQELPDEERALQALANEDQSVATEIARRAVTMVRNEGALPLAKGEDLVVASTKNGLLKLLREALAGARAVALPPRALRSRPRAHAERLLELARGASTLVVAVHRDDHRRLLEHLRELRPPKLRVVLVSLRSPYLLSAFPDVDAYVCAYGHGEPSQAAVAEVLLGRREPIGRLPVTLDARYPSGHGLSFFGVLPQPPLLQDRPPPAH
jgi:beta-N-acetylhexosaminidase